MNWTLEYYLGHLSAISKRMYLIFLNCFCSKFAAVIDVFVIHIFMPHLLFQGICKSEGYFKSEGVLAHSICSHRHLSSRLFMT